MTYELAKQLKDEEFYQTPRGNYIGTQGTVLGYDILVLSEFPDAVYVPTLSELIRACAMILFCQFSLEQHSNDWRAGVYRPDLRFPKQFCSGKTPEEAVAKLWLKLQKNH